MGYNLVPIAEAIRQSIAPKTWTDYSVAWRKWLLFLEELGFADIVTEEQVVLAFVCSLMQQNASFNHINKTLAGISFFLKLQNKPAINVFFSVRQALKGYRKLTFTPDDRRPISLSTLKRICLSTRVICNSEYEALLFHVAFVVMFFAALRISELVPNNKQGVSGLKFNEVQFQDGKLLIFIRRSKTDQSGRGHWITLNGSADPILCPLKISKEFVARRPVSDGCFLIHDNLSPLTKFQFSYVLKKCLSYLGLAHLKITTHSFRIGAATEAARLGLDDSIIKKLGRWESSRYNIYVRPNLSF